jgi:hypothetical protein
VTPLLPTYSLVRRTEPILMSRPQGSCCAATFSNMGPLWQIILNIGEDKSTCMNKRGKKSTNLLNLEFYVNFN